MYNWLFFVSFILDIQRIRLHIPTKYASRQCATATHQQDDGISLPTGKTFFPVSELAPLPIMVVYGLIAWYLSLNEMTFRQMHPLTTGLELEKHSHDNRQKVEFTDESSFGNAQMGHNLFFCCIFVEYSVFWQWYSILKCCNPNIANLYQSTLYFNCLH